MSSHDPGTACDNCCRSSAQSSLKCRSLMYLLGITQKLACQVKPDAIPVSGHLS
jgi:hypothetical protein